MSTATRKKRLKSMTDVLEQIKSDYTDMTPAFQTLAHYVMEHHQELAFASVARVANLAGSSAATVVRFSESLGLSGYSALQALAREELRGSVDTVAQLERSAETHASASLFETVVKADIANLNTLLEKSKTADFDQVVDLMAAAQTIHLVGLRSSFGIVQHFHSYLGWIGRSATLIKPGISDLPEQMLAVKKGDVCLCLSLRRYIRDTLDVAKYAHENGATVIAITDSELSPLAEVAKVTLTVPVQMPAFFESKTAVVTLMNAILLGVALDNKQKDQGAVTLYPVRA